VVRDAIVVLQHMAENVHVGSRVHNDSDTVTKLKIKCLLVAHEICADADCRSGSWELLAAQGMGFEFKILNEVHHQGSVSIIGLTSPMVH
jgi:hypothetical protein